MVVYILDASAFLAGVSLCMDGRMVVPESVQNELAYGAGKRRLEETILKGAVLSSPSKEYLEEVRRRINDFDQGLSDVDMEVLALALEEESVVVTDDYGIQNACSSMEIPFMGLSEKGVKEKWEWGLRCTGCGRWSETKREDCTVCGRPLKRKRK